MRRRLPRPRAMARGLGRAGRRALPHAAAAALVAAVIGGGWLGYRWVTSSDRFAIDTIVLEGNHHATDAALRARLGVVEGDNVFGADLAAIAAAVEADPWVADARVRRELPDRLVVDVREREPAALVELGGLYLVDDGGAVFKRADIAAGDDRAGGEPLPIVTGIDREEYRRDPRAAGARVSEALEALRVYRTGIGRPEVAEVHLDRRRGIVFVTTRTATTIRIGRGEPDVLARRLGVFDAAWDALEPEERAAARVVYADNVTRPDRVTVAFAEQVDN